jgi:hypothetical protein
MREFGRQLDEIEQRIDRDDGRHDRERCEIIDRFRQSGPDALRLLRAAALELGDVSRIDPAALIAGKGPAALAARVALGDWLGKHRLAWPGLVPMKIRLADWWGMLAVGDDGQVVQIVSERKIGESPASPAQPPDSRQG